jgi:hypothetical protein
MSPVRGYVVDQRIYTNNAKKDAWDDLLSMTSFFKLKTPGKSAPMAKLLP